MFQDEFSKLMTLVVLKMQYLNVGIFPTQVHLGLNKPNVKLASECISIWQT